jgi:protease-4
MRQFFKFVLATFTGLVLFFVLGFLLLFLIGLLAGSGDKSVTLKDKSVLRLEFDKPITERAKSNPFESIPFFNGNTGSMGLIEIRRALKTAAKDEKIKGVYLDMKFVQAGWATVEEIRDALKEFKKSGKFVMAYGLALSEKDYYLASVADQIYLNPSGGMEFNGLAANITFFKGTLEKLEIKPEVFRVGTYKSAVEPFLSDRMSQPNREQTLSFLSSIEQHTWQQIAKDRKLSLEKLSYIADSLVTPSPEEAKNNGLITHIGYEDEVQAELRNKLGIKKEKDKINFVSVGRYLKSKGAREESESKNRIAVILAAGDIGGEKTTENETIGDDLAEQVRKARLDEKVKAIVLRVNSGGGSSLTSDLIWREISLAKKVKPVIGSFSDVAASGGYYIAAACDTLVAYPTTITGSIGVFGLLFDAEPMLKNKLGITIDGVETHPHASLGQRPLDAFERKLIQKEIDKVYEEFTSKVAQGRHKSQHAIKEIASGRVWSGTEAKERGLVDLYGGLEEAIRIAAKKAKVEGDYKIKYYPEEKNAPLLQIFNQLVDEEEEAAFEKHFGLMAPYVRQVQQLERMKGVQMRIPFEISIK